MGLDKIFTRTEEAKAKDYSVSLLIDESGSMQSGSKNINAARAAVLFAHALTKLDIPYAVFGFNSGIRCYKTDKEPLSTKHHVGLESCYNNSYSDGYNENKENKENNCGDNSDGYAVTTVKESMRGVSGKKILIVMSDGYPADASWHRKSLPVSIKEAEKENISLFGIGIGHGVNVEEYYTNNVNVKEISELPTALGKVLIKALKKT
jgi:cobalamin biosynthesis protein CobT